MPRGVRRQGPDGYPRTVEELHPLERWAHDALHETAGCGPGARRGVSFAPPAADGPGERPTVPRHSALSLDGVHHTAVRSDGGGAAAWRRRWAPAVGTDAAEHAALQAGCQSLEPLRFCELSAIGPPRGRNAYAKGPLTETDEAYVSQLSIKRLDA